VDGGRGIGGEIAARGEVKALKRVQQTEGALLDEIER